MKKLMVFLLLGIFLLSFASAFEFDNVKKNEWESGNFDLGTKEIEYNELWEKYKPIEVKNSFGLGKKLFSGAITEHTEVCEYDYCYSVMEVYTSGDGAVISDVIFKTEQEDGSWAKQDVRKYNFLRYTEGEQVLVNDYETQCDMATSPNGTKYSTNCQRVKIGDHYEEAPTWTNLEVGEKLPAGNYKIKLEAWKKPSRVVDWIIETNGEVISEWAEWDASGGLQAYYSLDEGSGNAIDAHGDNDLGEIGTPANQSGIILSARGQFSNTNRFTGDIHEIDGNTDFSHSIWINRSGAIPAQRVIFGLSSSAGEMYYNWRLEVGASIKIYIGENAGSSDSVTTAYTLPNNIWTHLVFTYNSTDSTGTVYVNGAANGTVVKPGAGTPFGTFYVGMNSDAAGAPVTFDEIGVWNRTLTQAEVTTLYNSGSGTAYPGLAQGIVVLNSPADSSISDTNNNMFNATATVTGGATLTNMSLWTNESGSWVEYNTTLLTVEDNETVHADSGWSSNSETAKHGQRFTVGSQNITFKSVTKASSSEATIAYLGSGDGSTVYDTAIFVGDIATFNQNYTLSNGSINTILLDKGGDSYTRPYISTTVDVVDDYITITGDENGDEYFNQILSVVVSLNIATNSTQTWNRTISDGIIWNVQACDSDGDCGFATSNFSLSIDTTAPTVNILYPTTILTTVAEGNNITINFTATDTNIDSCWYAYNGTNTSIPSCSVNSSFLYATGYDNITVFANDTVGNEASDTVAWGYILLENSQTFNSITTEKSTESFTANVSSTTGLRVSSATLNYNGTAYIGSVAEPGNNISILTKSIVIPTVEADENATFYWTLTLEDATQANTTTKTQLILNLGIDNCSVYSNMLFNFTMFDEDDLTKLNGTGDNTSMKIALYLNDVSQTGSSINLTQLYYQQNPAAICSENPINGTFRVDGIVEYASNARFIEYYHIQNYSLTAATTNQSIGLYNLNSSKGQEFKITYKDVNFNTVPGAIVQVQREYVDEGLFRTVEIPMISSAGYTVAHLIRNDVIYNLIVMKDGIVLDSFENIVANCQNPSFTDCAININSLSSSVSPGTFENIGDWSGTLAYNASTRVISSVYTIPTGVTTTVSLNVTLFDAFGNQSVCADSLSAAGGTLTCTVPSAFGNATVVAKIYVAGNAVKTGIIRIGNDLGAKYGGNLVFVGLLLIALFIGIGVTDNPIVLGFTLIIGTITLIVLNIFQQTGWIGAGATVLWLVVAIVIVMIKGANR